MCGINGIFNYKNHYSKEKLKETISVMNNLISHRGPDDDGLFIENKIALGMRRLAIIDLKTGTQPLFNEDRSLVIVFNGEIYNYQALREELLAKGHVFFSAGDTEVILHCYEEYGVASFNRLKGMFAFALYDLKKERLTLVRDRAGEKPLYYYKDEDVFTFASELKSLIASKIMPKLINQKALSQYLQLTYIPAPLTIFEDVYKLLPGHYLEINQKGETKIKAYWDVTYQDKHLIEDYEKCKQALRKTLFNAVEESMVSDVSVGTFLSGGIDSTIITGIVSKIANHPIDTFTIGYHDKAFDESDRARLASTLHQTKNHLFYLDYKDIFPEMEKLLDNLDEPFADSSYLPTYMVSKFAHQEVKTVLTGDGGDELFGGYSKYLIGYYSKKYQKIPKFLRDTVIKKTASALPDKTSLIRKVKKVINNAELSIFEQRKNLMCLGFKAEELKQLLKTKDPSDNLEMIEQYYTAQSNSSDELSQALYTDFKVVLEGDMLTKVDRASMLTSLETRVPLLHKDVIELAARIPSRYKINAKNTKIILKDTFKELIPEKLLHAGKRGFGVPVGEWFKKELKRELLETLNEHDLEAQGIFNVAYIQQILDEHFSEKKNRGSELWTVFVFQKWYRRYFSESSENNFN